ncbi:hypothetical protein ACFX13_038079 [Malus domestica]
MGKGDNLASSECSQQLHLSPCMALLLCRIVVNIFVHVPLENPKLQRDLFEREEKYSLECVEPREFEHCCYYYFVIVKGES